MQMMDEDSIKNLGWLAIFCGVVGTLPFITMLKIRKYAVTAGGSSMEIARGIGTVYKPILNFHIMMNSIGYGVGMLHGFFVLRTSRINCTITCNSNDNIDDQRVDAKIHIIKKHKNLQ